MRAAALRARGALCVVLAALGSPALADAPVPAEAPAPEMLPTPYSAEQIRDVWQPGFSLELRTLEGGVETRQRMTVLAATADTGTLRSEAFGADGQPSEPPRETTAQWSQLRDHALFPAASATRERADCRAADATLPGWRYLVTRDAGDSLMMCFADARPGPPVELEKRHAGELVSRMEHVRYGGAASAEEKR